MVPDPVARLDHHEVEPQRQVRQERAVRQAASFEQAVRRGADPDALPAVHRLLWEPECPAGAPANLDRDEHPRRAGINRDQVQFKPSDVDVAPQDRPAGGRQAVGDPLLGGVAEVLGIGSHRRTLAMPDRLPLIRSAPVTARRPLHGAGFDQLQIGDRGGDEVIGRQCVVEQPLVESLSEQVE